jgi:galactokinase
MGNITLIKNDIFNKKYDGVLACLYSDVESARTRYISALDEFQRLFGDDREVRIFSAPGRTEIGGNHTDHQHGRVLAAGIELDVIAIVSENNDNKIKIKSKGYDYEEVDLTDLSEKSEEAGKSRALVRGMAAAFKNKGKNLAGFDAYTESRVLKGSGMSSSAAYEVLIGTVINGLFNESAESAITIAKMAQYAENVYFGKPCGLMDQMASSVGGFIYIDFSDIENPYVEKINYNLADYGLSLCIVDTGGSHADLTDDYADIISEMKSAASVFGKKYLGEISKTDFYNNLSAVREKAGDRGVLRTIHFLNENERVLKQKSALKNNLTEEFLGLINESGDSSYTLLQNLYSAKNPKNQPLPLAIAATKAFLKEQGAARVHGGGFAGTIQAFIPNCMLEDYKKYIEKIFGKGSCHVLKIRNFGGIEIKP